MSSAEVLNSFLNEPSAPISIFPSSLTLPQLLILYDIEAPERLWPE